MNHLAGLLPLADDIYSSGRFMTQVTDANNIQRWSSIAGEGFVTAA